MGGVTYEADLSRGAKQEVVETVGKEESPSRRRPQNSGYRISHPEEPSFVSRTGGDYFDRQNVESQRARYIKRREALGLKVSVEVASEAA
jgi:hypothetical protein